MTHPPPARLLDLTRLFRRAGRILTGVDRVEMAYLKRLVVDDVPCFGLVRSSYGYILLDAPSMEAVVERAFGPAKQPSPDLLSRLPRHQSRSERAAYTDARNCALARCVPRGLQRMLDRTLPQGTVYLNVGHSNLTDRVLQATKALGPVAVLLHDIIPIERPDEQRPGTVPPFEDKVHRVSQYADHIIYNSEDTRTRIEQYLTSKCLTVPHFIVSHLGTTIAKPAPEALPNSLPLARPYFVTVGTIEPRKNHAFLLDLWAQMGPEAPTLFIAGNRGWRNEDVFSRLDALPADGNIRELAGLNDGALAALVQGAHGVLFPSLAEGFGWPPIEASALSVPVLANDLAVYREVLGNIPIYASVSDRYLWINKIKNLAMAGAEKQAPPRFVPPSWDAHFKVVLSLI